MKRFVLKLILFIVPFVVVFKLLEDRIAKIPNSYNEKRRLLESQLDSIEILCTGASHALYAINPQYFSYRGFNIGNVVQSVFYDRVITERYIDRMPKLKLILINVSSVTLNLEIRKLKWESWRDFFYFHFWDIKCKDLPILDPQRYSLIALYGRDEAFRAIENGFNSNLAPKYNRYGYEKKYKYEYANFLNDSAGIERANFTNDFFDTVVAKSNIEEIEKLIGSARKRNIKVAFYSTPFHPIFLQHFDTAINSYSTSLIVELTKKHNCEYYNYIYDTVRFNADDFFDVDHLNYTGAEKFSKIVDSEIIKPVLHENDSY